MARLFVALLGIVLLSPGSVPAADSSPAEANKKIVTAFYERLINRKDPSAIDEFVGPRYIQHNPNVADGPEGLLAFAREINARYPNMHLELKRAIAEGDLVSVHVHGKQSPDDRGIVSIDIFRLENGKLAEHWDVSQEVPETSANDNGMF